MINLKTLDEKKMKEFAEGLGLPAYRAGQILEWIYEKGVTDIDSMTNLSKDLRQLLAQKAYIGRLKLIKRQTSSEDWTEKFLFGLHDGETIESVLIPDEERLTLCVSSQVGCRMACRFCLTGKSGFKRDLLAHEIADQFFTVRGLTGDVKITNVVYMGMGEPMNNRGGVTESLRRITAFAGFSKKRITISTCGILPELKAFYNDAPMVNLAVSLNATTDEIRNSIMPVNKKYPIKALIETLKRLPIPERDRITLEYVLLKGVNDTPDDAQRLARIARSLRCKVNLIPFNEFEGGEFKRPAERTVKVFQDILIASGIVSLVRKSKGGDILAACGQLRGRPKSSPPR